MRKKYGITLEQYQAMLEKQNGVCAVGGEHCKSGRALSVDHDHTTGKLRGLLCGNCNRGIGYLQDDPELIRAALEYILSYQ
jgi:Recombination endonuclease VII